ncbi:unannotated protein [freshwater metagenome]|uniref:Unannotated protein n=1 Tax=freshwater metagenome TaxID=449393 RepID=A0A6J6FAT5_9ZZZZ
MDFFEIGHEGHPNGGVSVGNEFAREVRIGCNDHERRAVQRVGTGRENGDRSIATVYREHNFGTARLSNPVALHRQHLRWPCAFESVKVSEKSIGVIRDAEVPLGELLLDDRCAAAFARAVRQDLFVREDRLVYRVPVDPGILAIRQTLFVQLEEQPLVPLVILGVGGMQHPRPVERGRVTLHRGALLSDVLVGPLSRVHAPLDGRVFGGKSKGIPPDGVQNLIAAKPPISREDVAERIDLGVTHVQVARRIREHVQDVLVRARVVSVRNIEGSFGFPHGSPLRFHPAEIVFVLVHGTLSQRAHARSQFYSVYR